MLDHAASQDEEQVFTEYSRCLNHPTLHLR